MSRGELNRKTDGCGGTGGLGGGSVNIYSNKYMLVETFYITSRSPLYCSTPFCVFFILMLRCSFQQE